MAYKHDPTIVLEKKTQMLLNLLSIRPSIRNVDEILDVIDNEVPHLLHGLASE